MGRLDLLDPQRDEDATVASCTCCRVRFAAIAPDPRLPLLQVDACWRCRDEIALMVGWARLSRSHTWWHSSHGSVVLPDEAFMPAPSKTRAAA